MNHYLTVFLGARIGGALRHGVGVAALRLFGSGFPIATITVNVLGSFVMGLVIEWFAIRFGGGTLPRAVRGPPTGVGEST